MSVSISVLIPSIGRPTLQRAIDSAADADEILIDENSDGDLGYAARHRLMERATGTHLSFMDDDDVYAPGAIDVFRRNACDRPVIAQMHYAAPPNGQGYTLWGDRVVRHGNVGTPMFLVPNIPDKLGVWEPHAGPGSGGGDYSFISSTISLMGSPVWVPVVVALIRPPITS